MARALLGRFATGEHVAVWAANCPEWVLIEFGAALAGITLVTVNPAYLPKELANVLAQSKAVGLIVQRANGFPPTSRRRRVLAGLGKWLAGTPGHLLAEERWFSVNVVRDVAAASAGNASPPEVAGLIALTILNPPLTPV